MTYSKNKFYIDVKKSSGIRYALEMAKCAFDLAEDDEQRADEQREIFYLEEQLSRSEEFEIDLIKAAGHKYVKRTGTAGNYKYWYKMPDGSIQAGDASQTGGKIDHVKRLLVSRMHGAHAMTNEEVSKETGHHIDKVRSIQSNLRTAQKKGLSHGYADSELQEHKNTGSAAQTATPASDPAADKLRARNRPLSPGAEDKTNYRGKLARMAWPQLSVEAAKLGVNIRSYGAHNMQELRNELASKKFPRSVRNPTPVAERRPPNPANRTETIGGRDEAVVPTHEMASKLGQLLGVRQADVGNSRPTQLSFDIDRFRRHDHGGGNGDDWLDSEEIQKDHDKGVAKHKSKLDRVNKLLEDSGYKPNASFDLGEKGHFSIEVDLKKK